MGIIYKIIEMFFVVLTGAALSSLLIATVVKMFMCIKSWCTHG